MRIQRALERQSLRRRASLLERGLTPPDLGSSFVGESPAFRQLLHARRAGGADRLDRPRDGRDRLGQGDGRQARPRAEPASPPAVRRRRVRGAPGGAPAERAVRPRARGVHGRRARQAGPLRGGPRRHGLPRRDRRGEPGHAGQAPARPRHLDVPARRRHERDPRRRPRPGGDEPRPPRDGPPGPLPRGPLLPAEHGLARAPAAARARRATSTSWRSTSSRDSATATGSSGASRRTRSSVLRRHAWPGNVRELLHVVEAAMVLCDGPEILPEHLPASLRDAPGAPSGRAGRRTGSARSRR